MMCQECGQREASVCFTTLINGEKHEQYLCPECVAKKQLLKFDLSQLAGQLRKKLESPSESEEPVPDLTCPECGLTYARFVKTGTLGCARCYDAFREPLGDRLLKKLGHMRYEGSAPAQANEEVSLRMERDKLKQRLPRAIEEESYEKAAVLRDRIRQLNARIEEVAAHE